MIDNPTIFPEGKAHFHISGPAGALEIKTSMQLSNKPMDIIAVACHPHPLYQGTMDNKVVQTMVRAFEGLGIPVVCFNYRGVNTSTGSYSEGLGELQDLYAVMDWVSAVTPVKKFWVGGFSFGSWIAAKAAVEQSGRIEKLLMIAPPVQYPDFDTIHPQQDAMVIIADKDDIVVAADIENWVQGRRRPMPMRVKHFPEAGHFFHGGLIPLRECIEAFFSWPGL